MMQSSSQNTYTLFVGIDMAAKTFTAAWTEGRRTNTAQLLSVDQTPAGYQTLQEHLFHTGHPPASTLIVMEATGTYWMRLALVLVEAGFQVSIVNAAQAHAFAKALLKRAKTDPIDAQTLAQLAACLQPKLWTPPPALYTELQQCLLQRDALVNVRTELKNQLHAPLQRPTVIVDVRIRLEDVIAHLSQQITAVERVIRALLRQDTEWAATARHLQTVTGIGMLTAAWIVVTTVNFTLCQTPEQASAYAGLAPNPYQSGTSVRGRASIGRTGNAHLCRVLYLAS